MNLDTMCAAADSAAGFCPKIAMCRMQMVIFLESKRSIGFVNR